MSAADLCRIPSCGHHRDAHWWQEPSHPDPILRCKECEAKGMTCLATYPANSAPGPFGAILCTTLNPDEDRAAAVAPRETKD